MCCRYSRVFRTFPTRFPPRLFCNCSVAVLVRPFLRVFFFIVSTNVNGTACVLPANVHFYGDWFVHTQLVPSFHLDYSSHNIRTQVAWVFRSCVLSMYTYGSVIVFFF